MNIFEYFSYVLIISKIRAIIQLFKYSLSFFYSRERGRVYNRCDDGDGEELVMCNDPSIALPVFGGYSWPCARLAVVPPR